MPVAELKERLGEPDRVQEHGEDHETWYYDHRCLEVSLYTTGGYVLGVGQRAGRITEQLKVGDDEAHVTRTYGPPHEVAGVQGITIRTPVVVYEVTLKNGHVSGAWVRPRSVLD